MQEVFITAIGKFLPNKPVNNDEIEERLGLINDNASRSKSVVLRNNKIKTRYYALDENGQSNYQNADLVFHAIKDVLSQSELSDQDIELLSCGTSTPDQLLPSHASMVHGKWANKPIEINSASGICCSGMNALKYAYLSVLTGTKQNAISTGSERVSSWLRADKFSIESKHLDQLEKNPIIAFEKDFLRWMLSDGAGAILLENKKSNQKNLKIHWIEGISYANEIKTCMFAGAIQNSLGDLISWSDIPVDEWLNQSVFSIKQDIKLLDENILEKGAESILAIQQKTNLNLEEIDYFLPHISSFYFKDKLYDVFESKGIHIPKEKWYVNLEKVGNVGSGSIYLQLEELYHSDLLKKGQKILLSVPESGRFSYMFAWLEVV